MRFASTFFLCVSFALPALAQSSVNWAPGFNVPGIGGTVFAATQWDPDGIGPAPELLVIGGNFLRAGPLSVAHLATWDGNKWGTLGSGFGHTVFALAVYNNRLYAAGVFTSSGTTSTRYIAVWDATTNKW